MPVKYCTRSWPPRIAAFQKKCWNTRDASAAAGPVGRHASAETNWKMETEILTYSRAKGVFAGLTLNGASVRRDDDSMTAIYGRNVSTRNVLLGKVSATPAAQPFLNS